VTVKVAHVRLCDSRMLFVRAYPRETQEMVFDAHIRAFAFRAASTTIYGRLPPQDDSAGIGGTGCTNLSGLLLERSRSWP
jgi:hypothetical protein